MLDLGAYSKVKKNATAAGKMVDMGRPPSDVL